MRARTRPVHGIAALAAFLIVACRPGGLASSTVETPPQPPPLSPQADTPLLPIASDGPTMPSGPRIALTASDGTGLNLASLSARAVLEGPLAFTEMHLAFDNPRPRTLEGTFKIVLPVGASISRFAMRIGERWQEGEIVERQRAREAYEDFLHKKQDPALLEAAAGNEFSARVFPIPAGGTKEILVSYAEEVRGAAPYAIALRGLPQVGRIDAAASVAGSNVPFATLVRSGWTPDQDFVVDRSSVATADGLRSGDLVVARVHPVADRHPEPLGPAVVLVDTSASRALDLAAQVRRLRDLAALVARAQPGAAWSVACFDQRVDEVFAGPVRDMDDAVLAKIVARGALGASDIGQALAWAGERAGHLGAQRVLLLSDGVATAGATDRAKLVAAARGLAVGGVQRVDALASGGIRDDGTLRAIATAGLPHDGVVLSDADDLQTAARRLGEATRSGVEVAVDGATWWYPRRLDGVQAGDEVLVYAELPADRAPQITVGGAKQSVKDVRPVERPLLERAWAQAKIASLVDSEAGAEDVDAVKKEIVAVSTSHRVLSPYTSLLVLETEADYARFGLGHTSLADILSVQGSRVVLAHRSDAVTVATDKDPVLAKGAAQFGMVGLIGAAASAAPGAPGAPPPSAPWGLEADRKEANEPSPAPPARFAAAPRALPTSAAQAPAAAPAAQADVSVREIGESFGAGGLGLSGAGQGAGGHGGRAGAGHLARARVVDEAASGGAPRAVERAAPPEGSSAGPYAGHFAEVMGLLERKDAKHALQAAAGWHASDLGDVMGLVALGESLEATGDPATAARAYGSIIDLYPSRADLRRMAGERLERVGEPSALDLALDTYQKALDERPDHPSSHRMLAYALLKRELYAQAFDAALDGLAHRYPAGRFAGVEQVFRDDLGLIGAAWARAEPQRRAEILGRVRAAGGTIEDGPSLRFVLSWETDANDVDLHVRDAAGETAFYSHPSLASGGSLIADVTTGYGPECFTVRLPKAKRSPTYAVRAHYYARGPMGYGMGKLEVVEHDGHGELKFRERPFVVMNDQAYVELGQY